jgi:hypothetical protein
VVDIDVNLIFWSGTTCHTLVHELSCYQPKATKKLLDIATRHTSGEEVVRAAFVLGNVKAVAGGSRAPPLKVTIKGARKGTKGGRKG